MHAAVQHARHSTKEHHVVLSEPASASIRSSRQTTARILRPTRIVGMSPRRAASYEAFLARSKYRLPASGTLIVLAGLSSSEVVIALSSLAVQNSN